MKPAKLLNWILLFFWMGLIFYLSGRPGLKSPLDPEIDFFLRKGAHLAEYFILTLLFFRAFDLKSRRESIFWSLIFSLLYALGDEWHQSFVANRVGSPADVLIDFLGILGAVGFLRLKKPEKSE